MTADDGSVCSDGGATTNERRLELILAVDCRTGIEHIGKHHRRTEEHIVLAPHTGIDGYIVLHLAVPSKHHVGRYNDVLADIAFFAYRTVMHDMAEMPNLCSLAYAATVIHIRRFMNKEIGHW